MTIQAREITSTQTARLEKARTLTEEQIEMAYEIAGQRLGKDGRQATPELIAAIIQALATNYLATIDAKG